MSEGNVQPPEGQGIPESSHAQTYHIPEAFFKYEREHSDCGSKD